MNTEGLYFTILSAFAITGASITVLAKSPLRSAMGLFLNIIALASFCFVLSAHFVGVIQILIYAGAVVVLFIFVIMLVGTSKKTEFSIRGLLSRSINFLGIIMFSIVMISSVISIIKPSAPLPADYGNVETIGLWLFQKAYVPFELISLTLLIAIIGATYITHKGSRNAIEKS